jgi:hypothetical protein
VEQDVWTTVITDLFVDRRMELGLLSENALEFQDELAGQATYSFLQAFADSEIQLDPVVVVNFRQRNAELGSIEVPLRLGIPFRWVTPDQEWRPSRYPDMPSLFVVGLSHVGFTADFRWAILYRTYHWCGACGAGDFLLLKRNGNGTWSVRRTIAGYVE